MKGSLIAAMEQRAKCRRHYLDNYSHCHCHHHHHHDMLDKPVPVRVGLRGARYATAVVIRKSILLSLLLLTTYTCLYCTAISGSCSIHPNTTYPITVSHYNNDTNHYRPLVDHKSPLILGRLISETHYPFFESSITFTCVLDDRPPQSLVLSTSSNATTNSDNFSSKLVLYHPGDHQFVMTPSGLINDTTAVFTIPNLNYNHSGGYVCLYVPYASSLQLRGDKSPFGFNIIELVESCSVQIAVFPPTKLKCQYVYGQQLACTWSSVSVTQDDTAVMQTLYRLQNSINSPKVHCKMDCPLKNTEFRRQRCSSCLWEKIFIPLQQCFESNLTFSLHTEIFQERHKQRDTINEVFNIPCRDIISLEAVPNLRQISSNTSSVTVAWTPPNLKKTITNIKDLKFVLEYRLNEEFLTTELSKKYKNFTHLDDMDRYVNHIFGPLPALSKSNMCRVTRYEPVIARDVYVTRNRIEVDGMNNYTITGLLPDIPYNVCLHYYNTSMGDLWPKYPSDSAIMTLRPRSGTPVHPPLIEPTGFVVTGDNVKDGRMRIVTMYWQPIDDMYSGSIESHIRYYFMIGKSPTDHLIDRLSSLAFNQLMNQSTITSGNNSFSAPNNNGLVNTILIQCEGKPKCGMATSGPLMRSIPYYVFYGAMNNKGMGPVKSFFIPKDDDILKPVQKLYVERGECPNEYKLIWHDVERKLKRDDSTSVGPTAKGSKFDQANYTIFWCPPKRSGPSMDECDFIAGSTTIRANRSSHVISLDPERFGYQRFAIAYSQGRRVSQMTWASCVYKTGEDPVEVCFKHQHYDLSLYLVLVITLLGISLGLMIAWRVLKKPMKDIKQMRKFSPKLPHNLECPAFYDKDDMDPNYTLPTCENIRLMSDSSAYSQRGTARVSMLDCDEEPVTTTTTTTTLGGDIHGDDDEASDEGITMNGDRIIYNGGQQINGHPSSEHRSLISFSTDHNSNYIDAADCMIRQVTPNHVGATLPTPRASLDSSTSEMGTIDIDEFASDKAINDEIQDWFMRSNLDSALTSPSLCPFGTNDNQLRSITKEKGQDQEIKNEKGENEGKEDTK